MLYFGGKTTINGTTGGDYIVAYAGSNYVINGLGGNDTILASYGDNEIITDTNGTDYIVIAGTGDVVTADSGIVTGSPSNATITLGSGKVDIYGTGNTVTSSGSSTAIFANGGSATVNAFAGNVQVSGTNNVVKTGLETFLAGEVGTSGGNATVTGGSGNGNFTLIGQSVTLVTDGQQNTVLAEGMYLGANYDISPGSGNDTVNFDTIFVRGGFFLPANGTVHLQGQGNTVSAQGEGRVTVTGGTGNNTVTLYSTAGDIELPGTGNTITKYNNLQDSFGAGSSFIDAGSGNDTVSLDGITATLIFRGSGDMLFLDAIYPSPMGQPAASRVSVTGTHEGLQVYLGSGAPYGNLFTTADIYSFGGTDVLHLLPGSGFTSVDQVVNALQPDGGGGYNLGFADGFVHFGAGSHLTAANFALS